MPPPTKRAKLDPRTGMSFTARWTEEGDTDELGSTTEEEFPDNHRDPEDDDATGSEISVEEDDETGSEFSVEDEQAEHAPSIYPSGNRVVINLTGIEDIESDEDLGNLADDDSEYPEDDIAAEDVDASDNDSDHFGDINATDNSDNIAEIDIQTSMETMVNSRSADEGYYSLSSPYLSGTTDCNTFGSARGSTPFDQLLPVQTLKK